MILKDTKKHECGCISERNGNIWSISKYCEQHTPNYHKREMKDFKLKNKLPHRGYTKSPKKL